MTVLFLFLLLFLLMFIGVPIAASLGLAGSITIMLFSPDSVRSLAIKLFETSEHYTLLAIPFFLLSGAFMTTGGVAKRLIDFANACVGHIRGGLAIGAVLACMLFAALSGSSPATVAAVGSIAIAGMVRSGYPQAFGAGIVCNAGTLGILIPPSIVMVVYAAATEQSVGKLFMAGVIPGIMLGLVLMIAIYIVARIKKLPALPRASFREWLRAAREAFWGLLLMVIILGGIYTGMFTPTEAAAVAAVYAGFVALFVYKDLSIRECPKVLLESGKLTIMLMFIIANAMLFAHVLTTEQIPQQITAWVVDLGLQPWQFLLVVNIVLLIAGAFMEPSAIILILAPILFPIAMQLGIDPIHLGIIMVVNMEIGLITPPVGLNLFVTSAVTGMPLTAVIRAAMPWLMLLLSFLVIITYVPAVSLGLPNMLGM
ncbi:C4-dicarboxylate TRAP transporter large permease protein DctM [Ectopseudomonas oleovorans]|uniref:TRAP transporter large permease protein n=1 Tax=Ectopseudomonas oleovorans TaxID=301 RepID=A0A379JRF1_ECTOL|nr:MULTISPECIES: C4-dicarboxylate TRAP transporter large permease protein DctM [Pseudomonas]KQO39564.1 C4-dicarboxylate ABC transporter permease [Pseudomonas sp. Leaf83]MBN7119654.1 C4-dicarboxylate ABC transporter permease [Pseudomonas oleovorans]MBN7132109.1 C4-dicarboxylate ABC transporter permease [Pseudomonas oleovorans]MBN7140407.1 C4-dicarboxylate ABC transporter permease [Pseudomonas oleovorans]OWK42822.1 Sialic acid TRAP transporter permease protein SiaT [Pseudomonas oleovorans subsp.